MNLIYPYKNMYFVIKSKNRLEKIQKMTLTLLNKYDVPKEDIYIFVSNDKDYTEYIDKYAPMNVIKGDDGIVGIDNFIVNFFNEGEEYIYMNDDVSEIYRLHQDITEDYEPINPGKLVELNKGDFWYLIKKMFSELKVFGGTYAGLHPCKNIHYMTKSNEMTCDLCLCMDPFSAIINNKEIQLTEFIVKKEDGSDFIGESSDAEKTIQHFTSKGGIVRLNHYCIKVEYHTKEGGYQGRTAQTEKLTAEALQEKYPKEVSSVKYKKNGTTSIVFKRIKSNWEWK
jgi:hypothetical protein